MKAILIWDSNEVQGLVVTNDDEAQATMDRLEAARNGDRRVTLVMMNPDTVETAVDWLKPS